LQLVRVLLVNKAGLSQHERPVHPADYHSSLAVGHRTVNKRRWSHDEKVLLAREVIRLSCLSRNLNLDLSMAFPDQTFKAIKGLRKSPYGEIKFILKVHACIVALLTHTKGHFDALSITARCTRTAACILLKLLHKHNCAFLQLGIYRQQKS